jgi:cell division protein FtsB
MSPMAPAPHEEELQLAQAKLLEAVTLVAATQLQLELVRKDPKSADERIFAASRAYREAEMEEEKARQEVIKSHIAYARSRLDATKKRKRPPEAEPGSFS